MFDLIVIGGGPAGYNACERAAYAGFKTILIEKDKIGGVCLNEGCIPTKTFLYSSKLKDSVKYGQKYGIEVENISLDHKEVLARKRKVVAALTGGVKMKLKKIGVEVVSGEAYIVSKNDECIQVKCNGNIYEGRRLLIATGSTPIIPPIDGLSESLESGFVVTNREMLEIETIPEKLIVIGGGVIGLEMASYFQTAGSDVTVIEMLDTIGGNIDEDIADILKKNLKKKGIKFLLGCKVTEFNKNTVIYEDKTGRMEVSSDLVLLSIGRRAFSEHLGIENIGVITQRGAIKTDEKMRTNIPGVYAAGDVNGKSMLAHTAYRESEVAINDMIGQYDNMNYNAIPGVIYTNPEVAGVGETEKTAKEKGMDIIVETISMRYSGRYVAENEAGDGILKLIVDKKENKIIGLHIISNYASEIIYGACMMIDKEMTLENIKKTIFPHPTVCEIIREAIFKI